MTIPDYQTLMKPVLEFASSGTRSISEAVQYVSDEFGLTKAEQEELLPKKNFPIIRSRVHWAITYLAQAGCLERPKRGHFAITDRGRALLSKSDREIGNKDLEQFPEFIEFKQRGKRSGGSGKTNTQPEESDAADDATPEEQMRIAHDQIQTALAGELLAQVKKASPAFFERLVLRLLRAMGYGGEAEDSDRHLGQSSDGGVDGLINEDALGLERVYIQAKRYSENSVSSREIRDFFGALDRFRAAKGLFVTTSKFTKEAVETANSLSKRIVLIDGDRLAELMIEYDVGVRTQEIFALKWVDDDAFTED